MRKQIYLLALLLMFVIAGLATAHPLGNFSVNQYSQIEVEKAQVKLRSVLDMAEIPTFQESQTIDTDQDGSLSQDEINIYAGKITPTYLSNLLLVVDGQPIELREIAKSISLPLGSGNLPTLRIEWDLLGDLPIENLSAVHRLNFENKNYSERVGWNEIVVGRVGGINIFNSSAFGALERKKGGIFFFFERDSRRRKSFTKPRRTRQPARRKRQICRTDQRPGNYFSDCACRFAARFRFRRDARDVARTRKNRCRGVPGRFARHD
jgi:hypothetical protein